MNHNSPIISLEAPNGYHAVKSLTREAVMMQAQNVLRLHHFMVVCMLGRSGCLRDPV